MIKTDSPFDNLLEKINKLDDSLNILTADVSCIAKSQADINEKLQTDVMFLMERYSEFLKRLLKNYETLIETQKIVDKLLKKLEPENPGDINHLYQNWNKDDTIN